MEPNDDQGPRYFSSAQLQQLITVIDRIEAAAAQHAAPQKRSIEFVRNLARNGEEEYSLQELSDWIRTHKCAIDRKDFEFLTDLSAEFGAADEILRIEEQVR